MKTSFLSIAFIFIFISGNAQDKRKPVSTRDSKNYLAIHPVWIQCIDSPNALLRYAQYTFEAYWQGKERPQNDNEEAEKKGGFEGEGRDNIEYSYEYKRFKEWEARVKNMLGYDGRVLTAEKQLEIWQQIQNEKREANK